jgi:hypothetical protein
MHLRSPGLQQHVTRLLLPLLLLQLQLQLLAATAM